jgi:hypothetical protein
MLLSLMLVILKAHTLAYGGCVGPKSTCLYILTLGLFVYAVTVLLGVAVQIFLSRRASVTVLTTLAYGLLWSTRDCGKLFRRWLHSLMMACTLFTLGIMLSALALYTPTNSVACLLLITMLVKCRPQ